MDLEPHRLGLNGISAFYELGRVTQPIRASASLSIKRERKQELLQWTTVKTQPLICPRSLEQHRFTKEQWASGYQYSSEHKSNRWENRRA